MLITSTPLTHNQLAHTTWQKLGKVEVPPLRITRSPKPDHSVQIFELGHYDNELPEPTFIMFVEPNPERVPDSFTYSLQTIRSEKDSYELAYFFANFGGPTYQVSVWQGWPEDEKPKQRKHRHHGRSQGKRERTTTSR